jgi:hypothetical protein
MLQQRPNTFAQTNLSTSFFACDKAADHTFRVARYPLLDVRFERESKCPRRAGGKTLNGYTRCRSQK